MIDLNNLDETLKFVNQKFNDEIEEEYQRIERQRKECIERILDNARLIGWLEQIAPGGVRVPWWDRGASIMVHLGEQPATKRARRLFGQKLTGLRRLLGKLSLAGKELEDKKKSLIRIRLVPVGHPGVIITMVQKYKPREGAKCRIVKERVPARTYHSLVCDL